MAPDGLVDCKKRNRGAIQRSLKQHYICLLITYYDNVSS